MKILVVGEGGREHCLAWKIAGSTLVAKTTSEAKQAIKLMMQDKILVPQAIRLLVKIV